MKDDENGQEKKSFIARCWDGICSTLAERREKNKEKDVRWRMNK